MFQKNPLRISLLVLQKSSELKNNKINVHVGILKFNSIELDFLLFKLGTLIIY